MPSQNIPLGKADWRRRVAREASAPLKNRFFEANPLLSPENFALLARPGTRRALQVGIGPIRGTYSAPGAFDESLFAVSGDALYQITSANASTLIGTVGSGLGSSVSMAATGTIGEGTTAVPNYLFICDGGVLWCYAEDGFSIGVLTITGVIANTETVTIDTTVYKFTSGSVDTGTPAGTALNPWLVKVGATAALSLQNLFWAISLGGGTPGTDYSTVTVQHATVNADSVSATTLRVRAQASGTLGSSIATTETLANGTWGGATLSGGGSPLLFQVNLPNDLGAIGVAHINGYITVIPVQNVGYNGRFYWIQPGETVIDALDFATAERSPDAILQAKVFSDQLMLMGQNTTENWITSGDADAPFQRFQGILFDRGVWEGTAVQVKESVILVDNEGQVMQIAGGVKVISDPSIEERIRRAIKLDY